MKENHSEIKLVKDIKSEHIQSFLNSKADSCSDATLKNYVSRFAKLEKQVSNTYNAKVNFSSVVAPTGRNNAAKIRDVAMSKSDFQKLESSYSSNWDNGCIGINLAYRSGLRASEVTKLQIKDINLEKKEINIIDSKGKRSRVVPIEQKDVSYYSKLLEQLGEQNRICPIQSESLEKSVSRHMESIGIKEKYECTGIHAIRKAYAQNCFDEFRASGNSIAAAWSQTSVLLGHGSDRVALMKTYITNIH